MTAFASAPHRAPPSPASAPAARREYGLDWLRVAGFVALIAYHAGMYFTPWGWLVQNPRTSKAITTALAFLALWRMPLLFFISGAGTAFNLRRRSSGAFARERLVRLLLPLVFGTLVVCPPQIYIVRLTEGVTYPSYLAFWRTLFTFDLYPRGNLSWLHLWFLAYILAFSLLGIPVFTFLRGARGRALVERLAEWCDRPGRIYVLCVPMVAAHLLVLAPRWPNSEPSQTDWSQFVGSLLLFFLGFVLCGSDRFLDQIQRRRNELAVAAAVATLLFFALRHVARALPPGAAFIGVAVVHRSLAVVMILALVGWARARFVRDSTALRRANTAVYPFYIVHQTVTVALGWAWRGWDLPVGLKFVLLVAGTFLGSWVIYEGVRRTRVTRLLFGMRA